MSCEGTCVLGHELDESGPSTPPPPTPLPTCASVLCPRRRLAATPRLPISQPALICVIVSDDDSDSVFSGSQVEKWCWQCPEAEPVNSRNEGRLQSKKTTRVQGHEG